MPGIDKALLPTTLAAALEMYEKEEPRGEYVLVLDGADREALEAEQRQQYDELTIPEHVAKYEAEGMDHKAALKQVAIDRGIPKREVYDAVHKN